MNVWLKAGKNHYTLVSRGDHLRLENKNIYCYIDKSGNPRCKIRINKKTVFLHRYIMNIHNLKRFMSVDHINWNTLDNTRENLRIVSVSDNSKHKHYTNNIDEVATVCGSTHISSKRFLVRSRHRVRKFCFYDTIKNNNIKNYLEPKELEIVKPKGKLLIGITFRNNKYTAQTRVNGKKVHIGNYDTEHEAKIAYDEFVFKKVGINGCYNFPEKYTILL
jgi:hypothetical protein